MDDLMNGGVLAALAVPARGVDVVPPEPTRASQTCSWAGCRPPPGRTPSSRAAPAAVRPAAETHAPPAAPRRRAATQAALFAE